MDFIKKISYDLLWQWLSTIYVAVISMVLTFILGRVLGPGRFGVYSYIITLASIFLNFQDGGFKTIIFREGIVPGQTLFMEDDDLLQMALGHVLLATGLGLLFVLCFPFSYKSALLAALICFGFQAAANFVSSILRSRGLFARDALWQMSLRTISAMGIVLSIYVFPSNLIQIFAGWGIGIAACFICSPVKLCHFRPSNFFLKFFESISVYKTCLAFVAVDAATVIYCRIDIVLIQSLTGSDYAVGQYAAAYRFLDAVILMLMPVGVVCFRYLRTIYSGTIQVENSVFKRRTLQISTVMLTGAVCLIFFAVLWGNDVVYFTMGKKFSEASTLFPYLFGSLFFIMPNTILTQAVIAQNSEWLYAKAALFCAIMNIIMNLLLIPCYGIIGAALATIATEGILFFLLLTIIQRSGRITANDNGTAGAGGR